jgi:hypothetical protein
VSAVTESVETVVSRNLRFGWWALLAFLSLGLILEALHGFKIGFYLDARNSVRREMWTLAHTHGTLISLVNLGFGLTLRHLSAREEALPALRLASRSLIAAAILMPMGFLGGGLVPYGGDPGLAIALVPLGGGLLFLGVLLTARSLRR